MAITIAKVISADNHGVVVQGTDGQTYTLTGSRSQRNNNPGAIAWSPVARDFGAVGYDTVAVNGKPSTHLAIFPTMDAGQQAQQELLFGTNQNHPQYQAMTLRQAISRYAPGGADGNPPPNSYFTRIANNIGVTPDTPLSDLSPAQQNAFMRVQADIESGGHSQIVTDSGGNVVKFPPTDIPNVPPPVPLPRPVAPNSSGGPNDRSLSGNPANYTPIPLAPLPPSRMPPSAGDSLAFNPVTGPAALSLGSDNSGYPSVGTGNPFDYGSVSAGAGSGLADLNALPSAPPVPTATASLPVPSLAAAPVAPPQIPTIQPASYQTVNVNGHVYRVGDVLKSGDNYYKVQENGTFTKAPRMALGNNTVASGIAGTMLGNAISSAPAIASQAAGTVGNFLGGLFGGGGKSPTPASAPPPVPTGNGSSQPFTTNWADPYLNASSPTAPTDNGGWGQYAPAAAPPPLPKTITTQQQVLNPAYTQWANLSGPDDPYQNDAFNYAMQEQTPAPPKYISVPKTVPNPKYVAPPTVPVPGVAPVVPLSPGQDVLAADRLAAQNPLQRLFGMTPLGHLTNFLSGATGGYGGVQQGGLLGLLGGLGGHGTAPAVPSGPTPAQQYAALAARALASQPNGNINNMGGSNLQAVARGQAMAQSMGGMPG